MWLKLPHGLDAKLMQPRAVNAHVAYVPGIGFFADGNGREYMRLSYCYPEPDQIREGVRRLARVIEAELDLHSTFDAVDTGTLPGGRPVPGRARARLRDDRRAGQQRHLRGRAGMSGRGRTGSGTGTEPHPLRAVVLAGGLTFEREVSLSSGTQVWEELVRAGVDAEIRDADADLLPGLAAAPADAVFIALHGATGEDGALRAVLDLAGVPYVGSPAAACRLAWDKPAAKSVVRSAGVTTPDWVALPHSTFRELGAGAVLDLMVARLGLPLMVKPASGGSALGVQKVSRRRGPAGRDGQLLRLRRHRDGGALRRGGRAGAVGDRPRRRPAGAAGGRDRPGVRASSTTRRGTRPGSPSTTRRPGSRTTSPPARPPSPSRCTRSSAWPTCPAPTRSSRPDGEVHFLEVNVSPGLTETSMFPMAVEAAGYELGEVLARLLTRARPTAADPTSSVT